MVLKSDAAPELPELKKLVAAKRSSPTVSLEVPIRESKANGAVSSRGSFFCCLASVQYFNGVLGGPRRFLIGWLLSLTAAQWF